MLLTLIRNKLKSTTQVFSNDLEKVQLWIFFFIILIGYVRTFQLINIYFQSGDSVYIFFSIYSVVLLTTTLVLLLLKPKLLLILLQVVLVATFFDCFIKMIIFGECYITHIQLIFMVMMWSFYLLKRKWAIVYAVFFITLLPAYVIFHGVNFQLFPTQGQVNYYSIWVLFGLNTMIVIASQYYYSKTLSKLIFQQNKLNEKLSRSLLANESFTSTITHELRNPLNTVIGLSHLVNEYEDPNKIKQNLSLLKHTSEGLLELINDVLDFNKLNKGDISSENKPFDLVKLIDQIRFGLKLKISSKNILFKVTYDPILDDNFVIGDSTRLMQVLINLIDNAVKYTPDNGRVFLRISKVKVHQDTVTFAFSVEDDGEGIAKDKQALIFQPFQQVNHTTSGNGLGLAIVKKTLEVMSARIQVESSTMGGSRFFFNLDMKISRKISAPLSASSTDINLPSLKILVLDDNKMNLKYMEILLNHWELRPMVLDDGFEAISLCRQMMFDVVLLDIQMPKISGYEVARVIKEDRQFDQVPYIIAMSGLALDEIQDDARTVFFDDLIIKPFHYDQLKEKLMKVRVIEPIA